MEFEKIKESDQWFDLGCLKGYNRFPDFAIRLYQDFSDYTYQIEFDPLECKNIHLLEILLKCNRLPDWLDVVSIQKQLQKLLGSYKLGFLLDTSF